MELLLRGQDVAPTKRSDMVHVVWRNAMPDLMFNFVHTFRLYAHLVSSISGDRSDSTAAASADLWTWTVDFLCPCSAISSVCGRDYETVPCEVDSSASHETMDANTPERIRVGLLGAQALLCRV